MTLPKLVRDNWMMYITVTLTDLAFPVHKITMKFTDKTKTHRYGLWFDPQLKALKFKPGSPTGGRFNRRMLEAILTKHHALISEFLRNSDKVRLEENLKYPDPEEVEEDEPNDD